jgi:hypothetical protein
MNKEQYINSQFSERLESALIDVVCTYPLRNSDGEIYGWRWSDEYIGDYNVDYELGYQHINENEFPSAVIFKSENAALNAGLYQVKSNKRIVNSFTRELRHFLSLEYEQKLCDGMLK